MTRRTRNVAPGDVPLCVLVRPRAQRLADVTFQTYQSPTELLAGEKLCPNPGGNDGQQDR